MGKGSKLWKGEVAYIWEGGNKEKAKDFERGKIMERVEMEEREEMVKCGKMWK